MNADNPTPIHILVRTGPHAGLGATFCQSTVWLGRAQSNDMALPKDSTVSTRHARVYWKAGRWWLDDGESKNGTYMLTADGRHRVDEPVPVDAAKEFYLGSTAFSLLREDQIEKPDGQPTPSAAANSARLAQVRVSVIRQEDSLQYQVSGSDPTVATYNVPYDRFVVDEIARHMDELAKLGNTSPASATGYGTEGVKELLAEIGTTLQRRFLPKRVEEKLRGASEDYLFLSIHPDLIHIPWELTRIGEDPMCLRFNMGRQIVLEEHSIRVAENDHGKHPLRVLIVSNPTDDLPGAQSAAESLFKHVLHDHPMLDIQFLAGARVTRSDMLARFEETDIVYFIGHAEYDAENPSNSGWLLSDGRLVCAQIGALRNPPALVFANCCHSGKEAEWDQPHVDARRLTGMVSGFLGAGVSNYIGSVWPIPVETSATLADDFVKRLLRGEAVGSSLRDARRNIIAEHGTNILVWGAYVLYGDPTRKFQ